MNKHKIFRAVILSAIVWSMASPALAQTGGRGDATLIAAAQAYLEDYQNLHMARLEARYAEHASFNDPTSVRVASIGGPFVWHGRAEILTGIESWKRDGVTSLNYVVEDVYEASGCVVFVGAVTPVVSTPTGDVRFRYRIVTIITIEEGLVVEHRDYTDYAGAARLPEAAPQN